MDVFITDSWVHVLHYKGELYQSDAAIIQEMNLWEVCGGVGPTNPMDSKLKVDVAFMFE